MMRIMSVFAIAGVLVANAAAEPSSQVAFDVPTVKLLKNADPAMGEELAKKGKCARCHGDNGVSDDPEDVNIAGLSASYIYKQLRDYQDRNRDARDMYKVVRDMDEMQMANLAAWFASQPPGSTALNSDVDPDILRLVTHGDPTRLLKACASCHGRDGRGGQFDHPALTGQYREYLVTALTEFREGDRENDVYARMRDVARALTEEEIEGLAAYYAMPEPAGEE
ncbi:MAG: c-type cytochrome [Thiohalobacterales bacterium]|nr:c-type cytochrome [Thiohalobacterales bacterium]